MAIPTEPGLIDLIKRGGGVRTIPGTSPQELLKNLIGTIDIPPSVDRKTLLNAVLEREALMSTAIGNGIALPHPRHPLLTESSDQFVTIAYTEQGLQWEALDGSPVHTVILIVSASARMHLHTLSRINFFCQQESFRVQLRNRVPAAEILKNIEEIERTWDKQ